MMFPEHKVHCIERYYTVPNNSGGINTLETEEHFTVTAVCRSPQSSSRIDIDTAK